MNYPSVFFSNALYASIGSYSSVSDAFFFILVPLNGIGLLINIFGYVIFVKIGVYCNFCKYFKWHMINSSIQCLLGFFTFIAFTQRYMLLGWSIEVRYYRCVVINYVLSSLYYYTNALDILVGLERLSAFVVWMKSMMKTSPHFYSFTTLLLCLLINLPIFFW